MVDPKPLVVIVHVDERILRALAAAFPEKEYLTATFHSHDRSLSFVQRNAPDLVLAEKPEGVREGLSYLERIKEASSTTEAIFLPVLPAPEENGTFPHAQVQSLRRIVDRLLEIRMVPEFRRTETRAFQVRPIEA